MTTSQQAMIANARALLEAEGYTVTPTPFETAVGELIDQAHTIDHNQQRNGLDDDEISSLAHDIAKLTRQTFEPVTPFYTISHQPDTGRGHVITVDYPAEGGQAKLSIQAGGINLEWNGHSLAFLDLYYLPHGQDDRQPLPHLVIDNGDDGDPMAYVVYTPEGARLTFEQCVGQVPDVPGYSGPTYGYPAGHMDADE